jgi:hypothetical protein
MRGPPASTSDLSVSPVETTKVVQGSGGQVDPAPITMRHPGAIPYRPLETASRTADVVRRSGIGPATGPLAPNTPPKPTHPRVDIPQSQGARITENEVATSAPVHPPAPGARGPCAMPNIALGPTTRRLPRQEMTSATAASVKGAGATGASISIDTAGQ